MTVRDLREMYLRFFESKGHLRVPSGSLIPYDVTGRLDESLLFNGAGMVQFKPYFRGVAKPPQPRLTNCQKCVRTGDIEDVGDPSHLTFFEMLGNFSFGDYFKAQAIDFSWEFLTSPEWLGLDPRRLAFTVFEEDQEAFDQWSFWITQTGLRPEDRIFKLGEDTNYWPAGSFSSGPPGPCGPNSEMFYWVAREQPPPSGPYAREDFLRDIDAGHWLEIWNDVFIQFEWQGRLRNPERPADGWIKDGMPPLPFPSVDTGMGLERTVVALSGLQSVYQTDAFLPIFARLAEVARESPFALRGGEGASEGERVEVAPALYAMSQGLIPQDERLVRAARIIADHIRTTVFCIADGVLPGNTGRGYVLRRLIRRAVLKGQRTLGFENLFLYRLYEGVVEAMGHHYPELTDRREVILETLRNEETSFRHTLVEGARTLTSEAAIVKHFNDRIAAMPRERRMLLADAISFPTTKAETLTQIGFPELEPDQEYLPTRLKYLARLAGLDSRFPDRIKQRDFENYPLTGSLAFELYDTFGFPLEVTQELAQEAGLEVDVEGYERALREAQQRSRAAGGQETVYGGVTVRFQFRVMEAQGGPTPTAFTGYEECATDARIVAADVMPSDREPASEGKEQGHLVVALDRSPFYVESGGQVGDTGVLKGQGFTLRVVDLIRQDGVIVHEVEPDRPVAPEDLQGQHVRAEVDQARRARIRRNHTATHLLHAALRQVLGKHVTQAGSYVGPDRLRFDFTHGRAMTPDEIAEVERIVNERALANLPVRTYVDVPLEQARAMGAMALFGEKYAERVRVVQIGEEPPQEASFSRELCGGTHVRSTGEIGLFKIIGESSAASGVRRIEALTGEAAYEWARDLDRRAREAAALLKANPADLVPAVERALEAQRELNRRLERLRAQTAGGASAQVRPLGELELAVEKLTEGDQKDAALVADRLAENQPRRVTLVGLQSNGKVFFVAKVGADAQAKGAHAGTLVREVAKIAGGGGGGRPDFATAGGRQPEKVDEALAAAEGILRSMVSP